MTSLPTTAEAPARLRRIVFVVVAVAIAAMFSTACLNLLAPWSGVNLDHSVDPNSHRWHHGLEGAVDALVVAAIIALLIKPHSRSLLAQYIATAALLAGSIIIPFVGPAFLIIVGALLLIPAAYPKPAALLRRPSMTGTSVPLLAVAGAAAVALLARAAQELTWQVTGHLGEHATSTAWATDAEHLVLLAAAGLAAATRGPGWKILTAGCAAVFAYLGTVAVTLPDQPGSWGLIGGVAAYLAAMLFALPLWTHSTQAPREPLAPSCSPGTAQTPR
jgi:hypothetical protein